MKEAEDNEQFFYGPVQSNKTTMEDDEEDDDDEENFADAHEVSKQVPPPQIKPTPYVPPSAPQTTNKV